MLRFALIALFLCISSVAQAHYFAWGDVDYKLTLAFSDLWKQQGGLPADAKIKVLAPGGDGATCTVFAKRDKRFTLYPRDYMLDVVAHEVNWDFWEQAVANYDDLYFYYDNFGALGQGDARYTLVDYIDRTGDAQRKRALVFATIYADMQVMLHCAAPIETFDSHVDDFGQIAESIRFEPRYATTYRGGYRDFLEIKQYSQHWYEPIVLFFWPRKTMSAVANCPRTEDYNACLYKQKPLPIQTR